MAHLINRPFLFYKAIDHSQAKKDIDAAIVKKFEQETKVDEPSSSSTSKVDPPAVNVDPPVIDVSKNSKKEIESPIDQQNVGELEQQTEADEPSSSLTSIFNPLDMDFESSLVLPPGLLHLNFFYNH